MATIDSALTPLITPLCPGATGPDIRAAAVAAARELCERSNVWQTLTTLDVEAGLSKYQIAVPAQATLQRLIYVAYLGRPLGIYFTRDVTAPEALVATIPGVPSQSDIPTAAFFAAPGDTQMGLYPVPNSTVALALTIKASFVPTRAATELDDAFLDRWQDAVVSGAAYRLMRTPDKPYTSSQAKLFRDEFEMHVGRATSFARSGPVIGSTYVRPRSLG